MAAAYLNREEQDAILAALSGEISEEQRKILRNLLEKARRTLSKQRETRQLWRLQNPGQYKQLKHQEYIRRRERLKGENRGKIGGDIRKI